VGTQSSGAELPLPRSTQRAVRGLDDGLDRDAADRRWASATHSWFGAGHSSGGMLSHSASISRSRSLAGKVCAASRSSSTVVITVSLYLIADTARLTCTLLIIDQVNLHVKRPAAATWEYRE